MEDFTSARLTSVRDHSDGEKKEGSSKLSYCGTSLPEPESRQGLLALAFGGLLWRRRRDKNQRTA